MRIRGLWRLRAARREREDVRIRRSGEPAAIILMYHRVAKLPASPYGTIVSPEHFAQHLDLFAHLGSPMGLEEWLRAKALPRRAIMVTFDDGYTDNLLTAAPLLAARSIPATIFVTAGDPADGGEFWWDALEWICLESPSLPHALHLRTRTGGFVWEAEPGPNPPPGRDHPWHLGDRRQPTERHHLFQKLHDFLLALRSDERHDAVLALRAWAGGPPDARPTHRRLSIEEIERLSRIGGVTIGGHTIHHPALDVIPRDEREREIAGNRDFLRAVTGRPIRSLAFPYGLYDGGTIRLARRLGFIGACTSEKGMVSRRTNSLRLPRLAVPDEDANALAERLERLLSGRAPA